MTGSKYQKNVNVYFDLVLSSIQFRFKNSEFNDNNFKWNHLQITIIKFYEMFY